MGVCHQSVAVVAAIRLGATQLGSRLSTLASGRDDRDLSFMLGAAIRLGVQYGSWLSVLLARLALVGIFVWPVGCGAVMFRSIAHRHAPSGGVRSNMVHTPFPQTSA